MPPLWYDLKKIYRHGAHGCSMIWQHVNGGLLFFLYLKVIPNKFYMWPQYVYIVYIFVYYIIFYHIIFFFHCGDFFILFVSFFICIFQYSQCRNQINNRFNSATFLCLSQARSWISSIICLFCVQPQWVKVKTWLFLLLTITVYSFFSLFDLIWYTNIHMYMLLK